MIDSLFFILQIIGIVILLGWVVVHDRRAEGALSSGPLAFKQQDPPEDVAAQRAATPAGTRRARSVRRAPSRSRRLGQKAPLLD